jgi:hypothetical protein
MVNKITQKLFLTLVLALCPVLLAQDCQNVLKLDLKAATKQAFFDQDITPLKELCLQELDNILALMDQDEDLTRKEQLVQAKVMGMYNKLTKLAEGLNKAGQINKAIALLNGLYGKLHEYTDISAWDSLLIAASPALQETIQAMQFQASKIRK